MMETTGLWRSPLDAQVFPICTTMEAYFEDIKAADEVQLCGSAFCNCDTD